MWVATDTKEKAKFSLVPSDLVLRENLHVELPPGAREKDGAWTVLGGVVSDHEGYEKEKV